jgi:hypothetical protein
VRAWWQLVCAGECVMDFIMDERVEGRLSGFLPINPSFCGLGKEVICILNHERKVKIQRQLFDE